MAIVVEVHTKLANEVSTTTVDSFKSHFHDFLYSRKTLIRRRTPNSWTTATAWASRWPSSRRWTSTTPSGTSAVRKKKTKSLMVAIKEFDISYTVEYGYLHHFGPSKFSSVAR